MRRLTRIHVAVQGSGGTAATRATGTSRCRTRSRRSRRPASRTCGCRRPASPLPSRCGRFRGSGLGQSACSRSLGMVVRQDQLRVECMAGQVLCSEKGDSMLQFSGRMTNVSTSLRPSPYAQTPAAHVSTSGPSRRKVGYTYYILVHARPVQAAADSPCPCSPRPPSRPL